MISSVWELVSKPRRAVTPGGAAVNEISRILLLTAIAALGVKTSLAQIFASGQAGFAIIGSQTLLLLAMALAFAHTFMV